MSEPAQGLSKGLILRILILRHTEVSPDSKSVSYSTEEVDLIWLPGFNEDVFRLVS